MEKNTSAITISALSGPEMAIFDAIPDGVLVCQDEKILYANSAAYVLFGQVDNKDSFLGSLMMQWIDPEDYSLINEMVSRYLATGKVTDVAEFRIVKPTAERCWVRTKNTKVMIEGRPGVVVSLTDINDKKELETAQKNSEALFHNIFRLAPEVMVLSRLHDSQIIDANPAFFNQLGLRRDDTIGKSIKDLKIWADNTFIIRFVEELKMTASMTDIPASIKTRGSIVRHFRLFAQKIEQTKEPLLLLIGRDVTEELMNAQDLQINKNNADLANRAKSEFLANMSHELRTPLNAILGFSEIIRDEMIGPIGAARYSEYAGDIYESGNHLLSIINDILDLSKVESGKLEAYLQWINPISCLEMCLTQVQQRATEAHLSLEMDCVEGVEIEADERLIKQICLNLLSNAIKFTPPSGNVKLILKRTPNDGLCLSVDDTGIGMSPDEVKVARRPFGQVDSSYARQHEGSGLGLPLVSAFAEKMEATMKIDSVKGQGTRVNIVFPSSKVRDAKKDKKAELGYTDDYI